VLHGPDVANFSADYAMLDAAAAASCVSPGALAETLRSLDAAAQAKRATDLLAELQGRIRPLAHALADLIPVAP
jgi:hypothetical protein